MGGPATGPGGLDADAGEGRMAGPGGRQGSAGRITWPALRDLTLAALVVLVAVLAVQAVRHVPRGAGAAGTPAASASTASQPVSALFVGDNYTAGGAGITNTYARITAQAMGWVFLVDAQSGTGFVADGQISSSAFGPYFSRLDQDRAVFRPDYVVVTGGRNDGSESPARVVKAATAYLRSVRQAFPTARLVIVAPFWVDSRPPSTLLALRDAERNLAPSLRAAFIDPLAENWITNENQAEYISGDRVDPTVDGHAYLAKLLTGALKRIAWPARSPSPTPAPSPGH